MKLAYGRMLQDRARWVAWPPARSARRAVPPIRAGAGRGAPPARGGRVRLLQARGAARDGARDHAASPRGSARPTITCWCSASAARRWAPRRSSNALRRPAWNELGRRGARVLPAAHRPRERGSDHGGRRASADRPPPGARERDQQVGRNRGDDGPVPRRARPGSRRRWATRPTGISSSPPIPPGARCGSSPPARGSPPWSVPPDVGGRFSVLSPVGLLPAALVGIDIEALLRGARKAVERAEADDLLRNPAALYAALHWAADTGARGADPRADAVLRPPARARGVVPPALGREPGQAGGSRGERGARRAHAGRRPSGPPTSTARCSCSWKGRSTR